LLVGIEPWSLDWDVTHHFCNDCSIYHCVYLRL